MPHYSTLPRWITCWFAHSAQPALAASAAVAAVVPLVRVPLGQLAHLPEAELPLFVRNCPVAMKHLHLLGDLDWEHFPERPGGRAWPGRRSYPPRPVCRGVSGQGGRRAPPPGSVAPLPGRTPGVGVGARLSAPALARLPLGLRRRRQFAHPQALRARTARTAQRLAPVALRLQRAPGVHGAGGR
jgi:hypothetical protein